jgi:hypothetical protein
MTIKDAAGNSLLMFVAATCVVLIVKALPQTPSPQQATAVAPTPNAPTPAMQDGVIVYYFHSNTRCPTCRTIEEYAKESVESGFAEDLKSGKVQWQVINYQTPGNEHYALDYNLVSANVVLSKLKDGTQVDFRVLPEVWVHTGDKAAFFDYVQSNLREFLGRAEGKAAASPPPASTPKPVPLPQEDPLPIPE